MLVKLGKFSSIPSYLLIFWHFYNGLIRFTTYFKKYPYKMVSKTDYMALQSRVFPCQIDHTSGKGHYKM